jgi:hypothetical protein
MARKTGWAEFGTENDGARRRLHAYGDCGGSGGRRVEEDGASDFLSSLLMGRVEDVDQEEHDKRRDEFVRGLVRPPDFSRWDARPPGVSSTRSRRSGALRRTSRGRGSAPVLQSSVCHTGARCRAPAWIDGSLAGGAEFGITKNRMGPRVNAHVQPLSAGETLH